MPRPSLIDLFCGAGGLTLGFSKAFGHSFRPVLANDCNADAVATYRANFGEHCFCGDIQTLLQEYGGNFPRADVLIGGPPCQGFSLLNKKKTGDPRNALWRPFLEVAKRCGAQVFLMENVPQLLDSHEYKAIAAEAERLGFRTTAAKLCAADYGVPQTRVRGFILGARGVDPAEHFPPKRTHYDPRLKEIDRPLYIEQPEPWRNVRDAVGDLREPTGTELGIEAPPYDLHFARTPTELSKKRYRAIPEEGMNRFDLQRIAPELTPACWKRKKSGGTDLFGRLWWDRPAVTMRTEFYKPEKGRYLHPSSHRPITHREAARFQSFPDDFIFKGSKAEIARQIGNAVPPLLAARLADVVEELLSASAGDA
jgi:DNA (cytosine-5)-methyltransferase 1